MLNLNRIRRTRDRSKDEVPNRVRRYSHVSPQRPLIDLSGPGRLRTAHVLALCGIAHSTLYSRLKTGGFPPPDGRDGKMNYWNTQTIRAFLSSTDTLKA